MAAPERVDVRRLAARRDCVAGAVGTEDLPRLADRLVGPAAIDFTFRGSTDPRGRPAGELVLQGTLELACDLCDGPLSYALGSTPQHFYFVADQAELEAIPVDPADDAEPLVASSAFDLRALIEDEVLLALPISPRHVHCPAAAAVEPEPEPAPGPAAKPETAVPTRRSLAGLGELWNKANKARPDDD